MTLVREHYIPLLTGKQGEFQALKSLDSDAPAWMSPYIDMPPIAPSAPPTNGIEGPREAPESKLEKLLVAVASAWGTDRRVMVDLAAYDRYEIGGSHPAEWLHYQAAERGIWLMAAVATDSSARYRAAVRGAAESVKGSAFEHWHRQEQTRSNSPRRCRRSPTTFLLPIRRSHMYCSIWGA